MENIQLPHIEFRKGDQPNTGVLVIEPLFPGYGTTMGNALRRTLLAALPGAAITGAKIEGVTHEFTTIPKVKEDVLELILNLKKVRLEVFSDEPVTLHLRAKGDGAVTAGDIEANSDVRIANPDLHIATLTGKDAELVMELTVERGRAFLPTEAREKQRRDIGVIAIDALFSPIRRVAVRVEGARVGQMTNFDKLVCEIETDGTISPEDAVRNSAKVLIQHFALIAGDGALAEPVEEGVEEASAVAEEDSTEEAPKKKRTTKKKDDDAN